jgi:hypothetical protein
LASPCYSAIIPIETFYLPVPVSVIFFTLVRAESLIDKVPVRVPVIVGAKVRLIVQSLPAFLSCGRRLETLLTESYGTAMKPC